MGLFSNILGKLKLKFTGGYFGFQARSSPFSGEVWDSDIVRGIIDTIATHAAKGQIKHVVTDKNGKIVKSIHNSKIARLLNERPNDVMSGFDLKYRFFAQLEAQTTAVMYIEYDVETADAKAIYPVDYKHFEFKEVIGGGWAIVFTDYEGREQILPLECCVVCRKFYNNRQASGDGNGPIYKVLDMSKASDEGFIEALQISNKVRGILKQKKAMLDPEDVKDGQVTFTERFKWAAEHGGIVGVDSMEEYTPLNVTAYAANAAQTKEIANRFYNYFRTPEEVVQGKYTEQTGLAWYESKIEPLWEMFAEAVSNAYFTLREKGCGNKIVVSGGVLMGTSYTTRVNIINQTKEIGILTVNEQRELLGYGPVEGGDIRQVSLNYINADKQDEYQTGKKEDKNNGTDEGTGSDTGAETGQKSNQQELSGTDSGSTD